MAFTPETKKTIKGIAQIVAGVAALGGGAFVAYKAATGGEGNAYAGALTSALEGASKTVIPGAVMGGVIGLVSPAKTADGKEMPRLQSFAMMSALGAMTGAAIGAGAVAQSQIMQAAEV